MGARASMIQALACEQPVLATAPALETDRDLVVIFVGFIVMWYCQKSSAAISSVLRYSSTAATEEVTSSLMGSRLRDLKHNPLHRFRHRPRQAQTIEFMWTCQL